MLSKKAKIPALEDGLVPLPDKSIPDETIELIALCKWLLGHIPTQPRIPDPAPKFVTKEIVPSLAIEPNKKNTSTALNVGKTAMTLKTAEVFFMDRKYHVLPIAGLSFGFASSSTVYDSGTNKFSTKIQSGIQPYVGLAFHPWATRLVDPHFISFREARLVSEMRWRASSFVCSSSHQDTYQGLLPWCGFGLMVWNFRQPRLPPESHDTSRV